MVMDMLGPNLWDVWNSSEQANGILHCRPCLYFANLLRKKINSLPTNITDSNSIPSPFVYNVLVVRLRMRFLKAFRSLLVLAKHLRSENRYQDWKLLQHKLKQLQIKSLIGTMLSWLMSQFGLLEL